MLVPNATFAWIVALSTFTQDPTSAPAASGPIDLRCQFPAGKSIQVDLRSDAKGTLELALKANKRSVPVSMVRTQRMLDQMLSLDSESSASEQRRTWLEARETNNGANADPAWTGLAVTFTSDGKTQRATLGGRMLPKEDLDGLLRQSAFVGLWLGLPEAAVVGTAYPFEAEGLIQTLFDPEGEPKIGDATITLVGVDPSTSVAALKMHLEFADSIVDDDGMTADLAFAVDGDCELNLGERRLTKITASGTVGFTGTGPSAGVMSGSLRLTCTVTTKVVGDPAASLATTGKFRDNTQSFAAAGFQCSLPAYWARLPSKDAKTMAQFIDTRDDRQNLIKFTLLDEDGDPTTDTYIESFEAGVVKSGFIDPKFKKSKTALGKAITYEASLKGDRRVVGALTVAGPKRKLAVQWIGGAGASKDAEADFQDLVKSLKPAK